MSDTERAAAERLRPWLKHSPDCDWLLGYGMDGDRPIPPYRLLCNCGLHAAILAIEAEASAGGLDAVLDVERLARAMDAVFEAGSDVGLDFVAQERQPEYARRVAAEYARLAAEPVADEDEVLRAAYRMALGQVEHDGEVINRLKRALAVASHSPHDQSGEPDSDSGFPVCSVCGAIQTAAPVGLADSSREDLLHRIELLTLDLERERLANRDRTP